MPGRGRPKKTGFKGCSKKLNFYKDETLPNDSTIGKKPESLGLMSENDNIGSDVIASPKEGLVTDVTASPILLHVSENNSLIPDITESTILLKILHTPFGLYLMLLHHRFCRKFCKLLLAKY